MKTSLASFPDVDLAIAEDGEGPPLLFVHGYCCDQDLWHEQVTICSRSFRCVVYDLRGHGGSSSPPTGYGIQNHVEDLLRVMDTLSIRQAHLVGLSMGGGIALSAALNHPDRVESLVLVSSTVGGLPWEESMWNYFRDFESTARDIGVQQAVDRVWMAGPLFSGVRRYPALVQRLRAMAERFTGANIFDKARYPRPPVPDCDRLSDVHCPTLVVRGKQETPEFTRRAQILATEIPGARLEVVPGAAHFVNLESPVQFHRVLFQFLGEGVA